MSNVLSISSQVVHGHVGNSAAAFALERLGHEAWQVPTVILSNHPGHEQHAGFVTDVGQLQEMLNVLEARGALSNVDAILSGYLPTQAHVALVADAVKRAKEQNPKLIYCCDPAIGDDPHGLYLPDATANALNAHLLPLADIITPNRFELNFLSGVEVSDQQTAKEACNRLIGDRHAMTVAATSVPTVECNLSNMLVTAGGVQEIAVLRLPSAPHGTGDLFAALLLGHHLGGNPMPTAFERAVAGVDVVLAASRDQNELALSRSQSDWANSKPQKAKIETV